MTTDPASGQRAAPAVGGSRGERVLWHGRGGPGADLREALGALPGSGAANAVSDRGPLAWRRQDHLWISHVDLDTLPPGTLLVPSLVLRERAPEAYAMRILLGEDSPTAPAPSLHLAPIVVGHGDREQPDDASDASVLQAFQRADTAPVSGPAGQLQPGLDCVETIGAVHGARLELRVLDTTNAGHPPDVDLVVSCRPRYLTVEQFDFTPAGGTPLGSQRTATLRGFSQMTAASAIARSICSPTCIAMVLDAHGHAMDIEQFAHASRHPQHGIFGMWPSNLAAAHARGMSGLVRCFSDAAEAVRVLDNGTPIVASIRFEAGELPGAALPRTSGHLVVLRGLDAEYAHINDPAAATAEQVPVALPRAAFLRAWLADRGVGYVLWPMPTAASRGDATEEMSG